MQDKQNQRISHYFDSNMPIWSRLYSAPQTANELVLLERKNWTVQQLLNRSTGGDSVLDLGCGTGELLAELAEYDYRLTGIDVSFEMIRIVSERLNNVSVLQGDFLDAKIFDETFDVVVALGFLEYQVDQTAHLNKIFQVLRQGGVLICSGPNKRRFSNLFGFWSKKSKVPAEIAYTSVLKNKYSARSLKTLLQKHGFEVDYIHRHGYSDFVFLPLWLRKRVEFFLYRFFRLFRFLGASCFANDIIVIARKKRGNA